MKRAYHEPLAQQPWGLIEATSESLPEQAHALARARAFAEPLLATESLDTGENMLAHARKLVAEQKSSLLVDAAREGVVVELAELSRPAAK